MTPRLAAIAAAVISSLTPAAARGAATAHAGGTIHLDRERGSGYQRPHPVDEGCLPAALAAHPAAAGLDARVAFTVERDGTLTGFELQPPASPAAEEAVRQAFLSCRWVEGRDPEGTPVVVRVTQPVRVRAAQAAAGGRARATGGRAEEPGLPPPPVVIGGGSLRLDDERAAGFRRPELDDPACLPAALVKRKAAAGVENKVKFAVMRDGTVSHFTFDAPLPPEAERAVVSAFGECLWKPALDPEGEPLAVWVVQPVKVAPLPPPPVTQRPLFE